MCHFTCWERGEKNPIYLNFSRRTVFCFTDCWSYNYLICLVSLLSTIYSTDMYISKMSNLGLKTQLKSDPFNHYYRLLRCVRNLVGRVNKFWGEINVLLRRWLKKEREKWWRRRRRAKKKKLTSAALLISCPPVLLFPLPLLPPSL